MINRIKTLFFGARTIKTSIAVSLSVYLAGFVPYSLPFLAGASAALCIQPCITAGIRKGFIHFKATALAALFGLALFYLAGANILILGLSVILLIALFNKLGWEEGINVATLTMVAIMSVNSDNAFFYALGRASSTLIGIPLAIMTNIALAPPRHKPAFHRELDKLPANLPDLYIKMVEVVTTGGVELTDQVLQEIDETQSGLKKLNKALQLLKTGTESPYGVYFEKVKPWEVDLYRQGLNYLYKFMAKSRNAVAAGHHHRQQELKMAGNMEIDHPGQENEGVKTLVNSLYRLARALEGLHRSVFHLIREGETDRVRQMEGDIGVANSMKKEIQERLGDWLSRPTESRNIFILMSLFRLAFDLEELTDSLGRLAHTIITSSEQEVVPKRGYFPRPRVCRPF